MGTHPSKVQGKREHAWHNPKKKWKQTINEKQGKKNPMQIRLEATKWRSTITKKT